MLTLSFYIAFAPAAAYADPVTDKIDKLQIDLQKRVGDRWTLSPRNKSVGAGVEVGVSQSYPVTATTTATTASGATTTNTATLTAERVGSKIFTPTAANVAKRFAGGVATSLVAIAIYDLLGKAVDYVLDPANNRVIYHDGVYQTNYFTYGCATAACSTTNYVYKIPYTSTSVKEVCTALARDKGYSSADYSSGSCYSGSRSVGSYLAQERQNTDEKYMTYDEAAQRSINQANKGNAEAQSGMQTVVGDMITKNEIDNSYFNDSSISNDTYNDVTNNYVTNNITNQYPSVRVPSQAEMAQAAANGQSSVTKTTQNANGSTTTTTTNFSTTNNNTTTNNNYNITNITVINPTTDKDDSPASTPASTTTPASTPTTTPNPQTKPFELPAFCDWAKPVCDFIEWVKGEPTLENPTQPDVTTLPTPQTDSVNISFDGSCPAPEVVPWSLAGQNVDITISYTPICDTATLLNPIIKLAASLGAVFIIAGIRRGDDG